jgi:chorismate-pyruvate lyase
MTDAPFRPDPQLPELFAVFPDPASVPEFETITPDEMPEPYHGLLVHNHHMTVTMEEFYHDRVNVKILQRLHGEDWYARQILLWCRGNGNVVQFGLPVIKLSYCSEPVREAILEGKTPLGRILIENNVLRRIEPTQYLHILPGPATEAWFGPQRGKHETYGRLGVIFCDEQPAIEVLEIVAPVVGDTFLGSTRTA